MLPDQGQSPASPDGPEEDAAELRSYGRRRGRKLSPRQDRLMRELLPRVSVPVGSATPPTPAELFPTPGSEGQRKAHVTPEAEGQPKALVTPEAGGQPKAHDAPVAGGQPKAHVDPSSIWLEIGFGGGEHLLWQARNHPDVGLIGAEPFEDGVVKVLTAIEDEGLGNIRVHADDVRDVLRWLPEASIGRAFVLFPDPWPKRRHIKRRLVNRHLLGLLARVMQPGAELRIATDIGDYARTILMAFASCPDFVWTACSAADWRQRPGDWPPTRYEAKALREGRRPAFLTFVRCKG
ncbi:MAG: tRNA (guanosine(46)-N(7))-methyltransferase TrmB [Hyphomicrobiaceae bacterium]